MRLKDITRKNVGSYLRANKKLLLDKLGIEKIQEHEYCQVLIRSVLCSDCALAGKCVMPCQCKTPDLFFDPERIDGRGRWGKFMDKQKWEKFMADFNVEDISKMIQDPELLKVYTKETTLEDKLVLELNQEEMTKDLGDIELARGESVSVEFKVKNRLSVPLTIVDIKAGCHCTVPEFSKDAVEEGEDITFDLVFTPNQPGKFFKTAAIRFDNENVLPLTVAITGVAKINDNPST